MIVTTEIKAQLQITFFTAVDQEFMLQFRDHIANELFQVFN